MMMSSTIQTPPAPPMLTVAQLAERWGIVRQTIYRMMRNKRLKWVDVRTTTTRRRKASIRIPLDEVLRIENENRTVARTINGPAK